jgi:hypothetical protein
MFEELGELGKFEVQIWDEEGHYVTGCWALCEHTVNLYVKNYKVENNRPRVTFYLFLNDKPYLAISPVGKASYKTTMISEDGAEWLDF